MTDEEIYERREQTRVKHVILRQYLERFAHIVGSRWDSITYVDGFAGPWNAKSPDLKDSSFSIALEELRKARATYAQRGRSVDLRCFFLEQSREAHVQLEDSAIAEYMDRVKVAGGFRYVLPAIVLHPEIDRTHFHLIYATRHPKGVEVFKGAEKRAMEEMERLRAAAQRRRREERTLQGEFLFLTESAPQSRYYQDLRERYLGRAQQEVRRLLRNRGQVSYDVVWSAALRSPLVWESDLKSWIQAWQKQEEVRVDGLEGRQRVPNRDRSHVLVWVGSC